MINREVTVTNQAGVHTRPASMIVRTAAKFKADFWIQKDGYEITAFGEVPGKTVRRIASSMRRQ